MHCYKICQQICFIMETMFFIKFINFLSSNTNVHNMAITINSIFKNKFNKKLTKIICLAQCIAK